MSYRESNKGSKERQAPTLGVRFTEVSIKRESTVNFTAVWQKFSLDLPKVTYSVYRHDKHSTRSDGHHRCEQTSFLLRLQPSLLHLVSKKLEELKTKS